MSLQIEIIAMSQIVVIHEWQFNSIAVVGSDSTHPVILFRVFCDIQVIILEAAPKMPTPLLCVMPLLYYCHYCLLGDQLGIDFKFHLYNLLCLARKLVACRHIFYRHCRQTNNHCYSLYRIYIT